MAETDVHRVLSPDVCVKMCVRALCECMCVSEFMYVCVCACVWVHVCVCMFVCEYVCMRVFVRVYV